MGAVRAIPLAAALLLAACGRWPEDRLAATPPPTPRQAVEAPGERALSVLIYNVEGLPWPARRDRGPSLDRIGDELAALRRQGRAPDVVLLQEAWTPRAAAVVRRAGYPYHARGPGLRGVPAVGAADRGHVRSRPWLRGERMPKLLGSGLFVLSQHPILSVERRAFSRHACAGFDCLAAKGMMLARIAVPGAPTPVDVATAHMNAQEGAARVAAERTLAAHRFQTMESADFIDRARDPGNPLVLGGDFNMKASADRLEHFETLKPHAIVRRYCTERPEACDVRMSFDGDAPWLDTQDLQLFSDGAAMTIAPVRVEAMFDGPMTGGKLSDHDGFLVTYRLRWGPPAERHVVSDKNPIGNAGRAARLFPESMTKAEGGPP